MEKTYKGATLRKYLGDLLIEDHCHRDLKKGEVLVKIMSASILPADLALSQGLYGSNLPSLPKIFGMEGSGIVENVGEGVDKSIIGKHCGVFSISSSEDYHGVWAQYTYVPLDNLLVFDKQLDFDKITNCQGNPLTAAGFIHTIKKAGKKSVAQTGATTSFGKIFLRLASREGIEVVNIVRKASNIDDLTKIGGKHFINTSEEGWEAKFKDICEKLDVTILFDCAGGKITGKCLKGLKDYGTIYHFGNMELSRIGDLDPNDFIFGHKKIEGWWLNEWLNTAGLEELTKWRNLIKDDFENNNGTLFSTEYTESFKLEDIEKAFETYVTKSGKVLIKPW